MELSEIKITIDQSKCIGCGKCVADCLRHVLEVKDGKAAVLSNDCLKCGHCVAVCPANAVQMSGLEDEILEAGKSAGMLDAENLKAHLKLRRSVRQYKNIPVEREKIDAVIEAGRLTPSGSNLQNVRYIVVQTGIDELEDEVIAQYKALGENKGLPGGADMSKYQLKRGFLFYNASVLLLVVSESDTNACLAGMSMELMAEALGLGTLYVGLFTRPANQNEKLRKQLGLTEKENISICLTLGYADVQYLRSAPKKPANVVWR